MTTTAIPVASDVAIGTGVSVHARIHLFFRGFLSCCVVTVKAPGCAHALADGPTLRIQRLRPCLHPECKGAPSAFNLYSVVITEAGNDPKVAGLVYIAAFAPDAGESVETLIQNTPAGAPVPPILPPQDGFLFLDRSKFPASFAADVDPNLAAFMADSQVPWGVEALGGAVQNPAWKTKPSWYLVTTEDKMIPPDAQRAMARRASSTVVEVKGSHSVYVSQPKAVASLIEEAAGGERAATA